VPLLVNFFQRVWQLIATLSILGCAQNEGVSVGPNLQCSPFQSQAFSIETGTRFSLNTSSDNCVGAMVDSNTVFYSKAAVSRSDGVPAGLEISSTAGISSLWPEHLEFGIGVTNSSSNTYCSLSFETTHYLNGANQLVFSAGPSGVLSDLKYLSGGNYGFCLRPGDSGIIRKASVAEIEIGPASQINRVSLGNMVWVDSEELSAAERVALARQQQDWVITPITMAFNGEEVLLTVRNDSAYPLPWQTPIILVYLDYQGAYLDFAVPSELSIGKEDLGIGEEMVVTFDVLEREVPKGRAWNLRFYFQPVLQ
jgi:hypothetical protein